MLFTCGRKERSAVTLFSLFLLVDCLNAFQITGAQGGIGPNGERPLRYEIHDFANSGPAFDLYILALKEFQLLNQSDPLSYFQIAGLWSVPHCSGWRSRMIGIHGFPQTTWDGVVGHGGYPGFCMHASTPFPTWHRPYVALYEVFLTATIRLHLSLSSTPAHFRLPPPNLAPQSCLTDSSNSSGGMLRILRSRILKTNGMNM
jgi:hypothetical protein